MQLTVLGPFSRSYFTRVLRRTQRLIPIPRDVQMFVVGTKAAFSSLLHKLPRQDRAFFKEVHLLDKISFSYQRGKTRLVVLTITASNRFLLHDAKALQGLLLHELMHLEHMQRGVYRRLQQSYKKVLKLYTKLLMNLRQRKLLPVLASVGQHAVLLLKDLYANAALIERGYGHYLRWYYEREFSLKKICPRPVFYDKLKRAVQKDPSILATVFSFEFALLSVILPFKKYKERSAKKLLAHLATCYNLNMGEVMRKCGLFIAYYLDHYQQPRRDFEEKYFHLIFTKVVELLT